MILIQKLVLLYVLFVVHNTVDVKCICTDDAGKLIFTHVIYRHGQRTIQQPYPNDPYSDISQWPVNWGELTNDGKKQQYILGQWLRMRYGQSLLSAPYSKNLIYIQSTDEDRLLESAYVNLAGLFPPSGQQIWNEEFLWQPIPVHTSRSDTSYLLGGSVQSCQFYSNAMTELLKSQYIVEFNEQHQSLYNYLTEYSGFSINDTDQGIPGATAMRDIFYTESLFGKTLPSWTHEVYPGELIDEVALMYYIIQSYTPELARIRSGYFLKTILDRSASKCSGTLNPDRSIWMYSTHDTVISSLLYALGMFDNEFIQYAAALLFELRATPDGPHIEIYYKKSSFANVAVALKIPKCGYSCPLEKMYLLYKDLIPTQEFQKACAVQ